MGAWIALCFVGSGVGELSRRCGLELCAPGPQVRILHRVPLPKVFFLLLGFLMGSRSWIWIPVPPAPWIRVPVLPAPWIWVSVPPAPVMCQLEKPHC